MYCNICSSTELYILSTGKMSKSCTFCSIKQKEIQIKNKCEHNRQKRYCKECKGSSICEHNRRRSQCKECEGSSICKHNKIKTQSRDCDGSSFCAHGSRKTYCIDCKGGAICEHGKIKYQCYTCNYKLCLIQFQRCKIKNMLKRSNLSKNHSIEYLGIKSYEFIEFFQKKMNYYNNNDNNIIKMNWNNIELDHIKPISLFDLNDETDFLNCSNYSNLQPLFKKDNNQKHNKWSMTSEIF